MDFFKRDKKPIPKKILANNISEDPAADMELKGIKVEDESPRVNNSDSVTQKTKPEKNKSNIEKNKSSGGSEKKMVRNSQIQKDAVRVADVVVTTIEESERPDSYLPPPELPVEKVAKRKKLGDAKVYPINDEEERHIIIKVGNIPTLDQPAERATTISHNATLFIALFCGIFLGVIIGYGSGTVLFPKKSAAIKAANALGISSTSTLVESSASSTSTNWAASPTASQTSALSLPTAARLSVVTYGVAGRVGLIDGPISKAAFNKPSSLITLKNRDIIIADSGNKAIRYISASRGDVSTLKSSSNSSLSKRSQGSASLIDPLFLCPNADQSLLYISDRGDNSIKSLNITSLSVELLAGLGVAGYDDGPLLSSSFDEPAKMVLYDTSSIMLVDQGNDLIRVLNLTSGETSTVAGSGVFSDTINDGPVLLSSFNNASSIAFGPGGYIYISDTSNHIIRRFQIGGNVSTVAGNMNYAGLLDGTGTQASFNYPMGLAFDASNNLYVADSGNHAIRKVSPTFEVSTIAGNGVSGFADGIGTSALFNTPTDIQLNPDGNLLITDSGNSVIRLYALVDLAATSSSSSTTTTLAVVATSRRTSTTSSVSTRTSTTTSPVRSVVTIATTTCTSVSTTSTTHPSTTTSSICTQYSSTYSYIFAGSGSAWTQDGTGVSASFNHPSGIALDSSFNVYVSESYSHTIRKISSVGVVSTYAGTTDHPGSLDESGVSASFCSPYGIALNSDESFLYVADSCNHLIRRIDLSSALVSTVAGTAGVPGSDDGIGVLATFNTPYGIALDLSDNVYVSDSVTHIIRKIDGSGQVTTLAGNANSFGYADGFGAAAMFYSPKGLAIDSFDNLFVADSDNSLIRNVSLAGMVSTYAGKYGVFGSADGNGLQATFNAPLGLSTDNYGNLYVTDDYVPAVRVINTNQDVITISDTEWEMYGYGALVVNPEGTIAFVADTYEAVIREAFIACGGPNTTSTSTLQSTALPTTSMIHTTTTTTTIPSTTASSTTATSICTQYSSTYSYIFAGSGASLTQDGTGVGASFNNPRGIALDSSFNIYVSESYSHTIRKISSAGVVSTYAGTVDNAGSLDNSGTSASFCFPQGIVLNSDETFLYVADSSNHLIRRIDLSSALVSTVAGAAGVSGSADGIGILATFNTPYGIALDSSDNVYVSDLVTHIIRKIDGSRHVTTFAGTAGVYGYADGFGAAAMFYYPRGLAIDSFDNLFVADQNNGVIRNVSLAGMVSTYAGAYGSSGSDDGNGLHATFSAPLGLTTDNYGNLYVTDTYVLAVRVINTNQDVITISGTEWGTHGYGAVAVNPAGSIAFVADTYEAVIREAFIACGGPNTTSTSTLQSTALPTTSMIHTTTTTTLVHTTLPSTTTSSTTATSVCTQYSSTYSYIFAGSGSPATVDGTGDLASFDTPSSIALDSSLNIYVSEPYSHTIRKVSPAGDVVTYAGTTGSYGSTDGSGTAAYFNSPNGIALNSDETFLYVADSLNHLIRRIDLSSAFVSTVAGTAVVAGSDDGIGILASFNTPHGLALDSNDNVYVSDLGSHIIRKIDGSGQVTTLAGTSGVSGYADGFGADAMFFSPKGLVIDLLDNLFVADSDNSLIRNVSLAGMVGTYAGAFGGYGSKDQNGLLATFSAPSVIATDNYGNLYITDDVVPTVRVINTNLDVITIFATGWSSFGYGNGYAGVAVNPEGSVAFVANTFDSVIEKAFIACGPPNCTTTVTRLAGTLATGSHDDTFLSATFNGPWGIEFDGSDKIYVSDSINNVIRELTLSTSMVATLAGTGSPGYHDAIGTSATFNFPTGLVLDAGGYLYICDMNNNVIRKVDTNNAGDTTTFAGSGVAGLLDGVGTAAKLFAPSGIAIDSSGVLYVADDGNNAVRTITSDGTVTTLAGKGNLITGHINGLLADATFYLTFGIGVDVEGTVYVSEYSNNDIREITTDGQVSLFAGTYGAGSNDGPGSSATFNVPYGISLDSDGNIYVADMGSYKIRKVTSAGYVTTIAGSGAIGYADGSGTTSSFNSPTDVALSLDGLTIYVSDSNNNAIRKISLC